MSAEYFCKHCNKPCPKHHNYCNFDCHIAACEAAGYTKITPNNLPVQCITGTGLLLECEHGDHPNYIKPVTVTLHGFRYNSETYMEEYSPEYSCIEIHALIFHDNTCAVTLHEYCYFFWMNNKLKYTSLHTDYYKEYNATLKI